MDSKVTAGRFAAAALWLLIAVLFCLDWRSPWMQEYGGRLAWLGMTLLGAVLAAILAERSHVARCMAWLAAATAAGLLPWVGSTAVLAGLMAATAGAVLSLLLWCAGRASRPRILAGLGRAMALLALSGMALLPTVVGDDESPDPGQDPAQVLAGLAAADQADRRNGNFILNPMRDHERRQQVLAQLQRSHSLPGQALADAGLVLLHGQSLDELKLALRLLEQAVAAGHDRSVALARAARDRFLLAQGLPQVHGTQWAFRP